MVSKKARMMSISDEIKASGLFDRQWYQDTYRDVAISGLKPLAHFVRIGMKIGRDPGPGFDTKHYLAQVSKEELGDLWPITHFLRIGKAKGLLPKPSQSAMSSSPALTKDAMSAGGQPDVSGARPMVRSSAQSDSYLSARQDVLASGFWDERWYLEQYFSEYTAWRQNRSSFNAPIDHYLQVGGEAGYRPSRVFSCDKAFTADGTNPILNFLSKIRPNFHFDENVWVPDAAEVAAFCRQKAKRTSKKVVYCCILDSYDTLVQPYYIDPNWDYVCFTDDPQQISKGTEGIWEIREALHPQMAADRRNRYHKMHPHELFPEYEESIYVDGNVNVISSYLFDTIGKRKLPLLLPKHFARNCAYDEAEVLLASNRTTAANRDVLPDQLEFLKSMKFPENYGLTENNIIYRRHHDDTVKLVMQRWWDMLCAFTSRDQLGLSYALWKSGIAIQDVSFPNARLLNRDFWVFRHQGEAGRQVQVSIKNKIRPAFEDECVPVVLSCNESFIGYLGVVLTSIIENASDDRNYDIIVLENDISQASKEKIRTLEKRNVSIRFNNMRDTLEQLEGLNVYVEGYVPAETYNKIFLKEMMEGYRKVLYIDTDIVIRSDIAELYDTELFGKALGASRNVANIHAAHLNKKIRGRAFGDYLVNTLGVTRFEDYFQAGIIVLDLESDKAKNLLKLSLEKLKEIEKPIFFDQCIFNSIFFEDVFFLSTTWNHVWYLQEYSYLRYTLQDDVFFDYAKTRLNPKIVHYASGDKPTNKFDWRLSSYFWDYVSKSPYADDLIGQVVEKTEESDSKTPDLAELRSEPLPRVLVHLHAFYVDQMDYMLEKLSNIHSVTWDLVVTASGNTDEVEQIIKAKFESYEILKVGNKGFDAYPFLKVIQSKNLSQYDYVMKLHTKNARPENDQSQVYEIPVPGYKWRDDLVDALLQSTETFADALKRFDAEPDLGCLASGKYIFSINENRERKTYNLRHWMNVYGIESGAHYVGGTMFLTRSFPLERLKKINPEELDFASGDKTSGSHKNLAHVFERLFGLVIENEGLAIEGV